MATKVSSPEERLADALSAFQSKPGKSEVNDIEGQVKEKSAKSEPPKADKKGSRSSRLKSRTWMITEQLDYFTKKDEETWKDFFTRLCESDEKIVDWAYIIHNADTYTKEELDKMKAEGQDITGKEVGSSKEDHVHIVIRYDNPVRLSAVSKLFGVPDQQVSCETDPKKKRYAFQNMLSYLTHRTPGSQTKHQYDFSEVVYKFADGRSYEEHMKSTAKAVKKAEAKHETSQFDLLWGMYNSGLISFNKFKSMITPDLAKQWGTNAKEIQATKFLQDDREALKFLNEFTQPQKVIWLYGGSGVGKSSGAKYMASMFAKRRYPDEPAAMNSYQVLTSSRDPFQTYEPTQHTVILDELRPRKTIEPSDWLALFDPYGSQDPLGEGGLMRQLPARYHDKLQATGVIIITSIIDPVTWWNRVNGLKPGIEYDPGAFKALQELSPCALYGSEKFPTRYDREFLDDYMEYHYHNGTPDPEWYEVKTWLNRHWKQLPWNWIEEDVHQILRRMMVFNLTTDETGRVLYTQMKEKKHADGWYDLEEAGSPFEDPWSLEEVWSCQRRQDDKPFPSDQMMDEKQQLTHECFDTYEYVIGGKPSFRRRPHHYIYWLAPTNLEELKLKFTIKGISQLGSPF